MLLLWIATALAAPCPDLDGVMHEAWATFNDAELDLTKGHLATAHESLLCQGRVVTTQELLDIFRLESLVALAQDDRSGAIYATIRIVTIDPDGEPDADLGPVFAELHDTWSERLGSSWVRLVAEGDGSVWVDGKPLEGDIPMRVLAGEHFVQVLDSAGWGAIVAEFDRDTRFDVGEGISVGPADLPDPLGPDGPIEPVKPDRRGHRMALVGIGATSVGLGAASLGYGYGRHVAFKNNAYRPPAFGDCTRDDACYAEAREQRIRSDAAVIRALYASGYGLLAMGSSLLAVDLLVAPTPTGGGTMLGVRVDW